ncbi:MAG: YARHG domain-containing protein [Eubacteriales bacterium]|nr:YARHG domain-containing protein [Eubacteriales bacterium]
MVQCPACGNMIRTEAKICPFCGTAVDKYKGPEVEISQVLMGASKKEAAEELTNHGFLDDSVPEMNQGFMSDTRSETNPGFMDNMEPEMNSEFLGEAGSDREQGFMDETDSEGEQEFMDETDPERNQDSMYGPEYSKDPSPKRRRARGTFHVSAKEKKRIRRRNIAIVSIIGILLVGVLTTIFVLSSRKPTVELLPYITVKTSGYDSIGQATANFDYDQACADYSKKIKNIDQMLSECVHFELDHTENLKNGDEIILRWQCDDERAKKTYGCILEYTTLKVTVEDLDEVESFDAFEGVKVTFEGINGHGSASYDAKNNKYVKDMDLYFTFDKSKDLSNGDVITLWINDFKEKDTTEFLERYGKVPSPLSKEFTVEGLQSYVTSGDELSDEVLKQMKDKAEKYYDSHLSEEFTSEGEEFKEINYLGYYLLHAKKPEEQTPVNKIYLVYKARVLNTAAPYHQENVIYWFMRFKELRVSDQGEIDVDLDDYYTVENTFSVKLGAAASWYYHGYETLDALYEEVVADQSDDYAHEETVKDDGKGPSDVEKDEEATTEDASTEEQNATTESDDPASRSTSEEEGIIFSDSSSRYLTESEISSLSDEEIRSATNEIFARAGYIFKDTGIGDFYKKYSWYHPTTPADQFDMDQLNEYEVANVVLLQKVRDSRH